MGYRVGKSTAPEITEFRGRVMCYYHTHCTVVRVAESDRVHDLEK